MLCNDLRRIKWIYQGIRTSGVTDGGQGGRAATWQAKCENLAPI